MQAVAGIALQMVASAMEDSKKQEQDLKDKYTSPSKDPNGIGAVGGGGTTNPNAQMFSNLVQQQGPMQGSAPIGTAGAQSALRAQTNAQTQQPSLWSAMLGAMSGGQQQPAQGGAGGNFLGSLMTRGNPANAQLAAQSAEQANTDRLLAMLQQMAQ